MSSVEGGYEVSKFYRGKLVDGKDNLPGAIQPHLSPVAMAMLRRPVSPLSHSNSITIFLYNAYPELNFVRAVELHCV